AEPRPGDHLRYRRGRGRPRGGPLARRRRVAVHRGLARGAAADRAAAPGRFNVANALAAFAAGLARGTDPAVIGPALESVAGVPGRCEVVDEGQPFTVLVDYAHSPDSLEKILHLAAQVSTGRRIVVFGCGGDRDRTKRP